MMFCKIMLKSCFNLKNKYDKVTFNTNSICQNSGKKFIQCFFFPMAVFINCNGRSYWHFPKMCDTVMFKCTKKTSSIVKFYNMDNIFTFLEFLFIYVTQTFMIQISFQLLKLRKYTFVIFEISLVVVLVKL